MLTKKLLSIVAASVLLFSSAASAKIVTFAYTGTVTYGSDLAPVGSPITGRFSYDDKAKPQFEHTRYAYYYFPDSFSITANVNGHLVTTTNLHVNIWNNMGGNTEDMVDVSGSAPLVDGVAHADGAFVLRLASQWDETKVLHNTRLPASFEVAAFNSTLTAGEIRKDGGQAGTLIQFSIESIVNVPDPEPARDDQ